MHNCEIQLKYIHLKYKLNDQYSTKRWLNDQKWWSMYTWDKKPWSNNKFRCRITVMTEIWWRSNCDDGDDGGDEDDAGVTVMTEMMVE